jgi:hypothetical protein
LIEPAVSPQLTEAAAPATPAISPVIQRQQAGLRVTGLAAATIPEPLQPPLADEIRPAEPRSPHTLAPGRLIARMEPGRSPQRQVETAAEVEIHIGRIEVTAVPPPVTRPVASQPRKSLDLGEYLKRGRGRPS